MRLFIRVLLAIWCSGNLLGAFAQSTTIRSGFVIVTPVSGNIAGLIATETIENRTAVEQAVIAPSPLITSASILVPLGPVAENTTALAIANPSAGSGGVNLVLTGPVGEVVLNTTFVLGPHRQLSRYLNEFFATPPDKFSTPLLLTVSSEIPVAILALHFRGADFTSIPLTSLSTPTPVPIQSTTPSTLSNSIPASPAGPFTGFGLGLPPPSPSPAPIPGLLPATSLIGGAGALVFAQVAVGGGWSTKLAVGNTSSGTQIIRIDFFGSDGSHSSSLSEIVIQPRGVSFTDLGAGAVQ